MEGGGINLTPPPRQPVSKPEVRLNRVNIFATKYSFSYIAESKLEDQKIELVIYHEFYLFHKGSVLEK